MALQTLIAFFSQSCQDSVAADCRVADAMRRSSLPCEAAPSASCSVAESLEVDLLDVEGARGVLDLRSLHRSWWHPLLLLLRLWRDYHRVLDILFLGVPRPWPYVHLLDLWPAPPFLFWFPLDCPCFDDHAVVVDKVVDGAPFLPYPNAFAPPFLEVLALVLPSPEPKLLAQFKSFISARFSEETFVTCLAVLRHHELRDVLRSVLDEPGHHRMSCWQRAFHSSLQRQLVDPDHALDDLHRVLDRSVALRLCLRWLFNHYFSIQLLHDAIPQVDQGRLIVDLHEHFLPTPEPLDVRARLLNSLTKVPALGHHYIGHDYPCVPIFCDEDRQGFVLSFLTHETVIHLNLWYPSLSLLHMSVCRIVLPSPHAFGAPNAEG